MYLGDFAASSIVRMLFDTTSSDGSLLGLVGGVVKVYKDAGTAERTAGVSLTADFDSITGLNLVTVNTAAVFYAAGSTFHIVIDAGTVDGVSVAGRVVGIFSVEGRYSVPAAAIATAVWASGTRTLTSFGTLVADIWAYATRTLTAGGLAAADVWAYATRTLTSFGTLVADIESALSAHDITVESPVTEDGDIEIIPGDAYTDDHNRQIDIAITGAPTLVGATVVLVIDGSGLSITASSVATAGSATQTPRFELTATQTATLAKIGTTAYEYQVQVTWAADSPAQPAVLVRGNVSTVRRATV